MKRFIFAAVAFSVACSGSSTAPSPTVSASSMTRLTETVAVGEPETNNTGGGKACVLTPALPNNIPVCNYTCPNGITFSTVNVGYPVTSCVEVAPQPKKN